MYSSLWEFGLGGTIVGCVMVWFFQEIWGAQSSKWHKKLYVLLYKLGSFSRASITREIESIYVEEGILTNIAEGSHRIEDLKD